jgi:hypothetical protein
MTLQETVTTIQKWIKSCDKPEQLNLLLKVIDDYVTIERIPLSSYTDILGEKIILLEEVEIQNGLIMSELFYWTKFSPQ